MTKYSTVQLDTLRKEFSLWLEQGVLKGVTIDAVMLNFEEANTSPLEDEIADGILRIDKLFDRFGVGDLIKPS